MSAEAVVEPVCYCNEVMGCCWDECPACWGVDACVFGFDACDHRFETDEDERGVFEQCMSCGATR